MLSYPLVKQVHVTCVAVSVLGFALRGAAVLAEHPVMRTRWVRIVPHMLDTLLLVSALVMVFWSAQYPFVEPWLTAKVLGLVAYVVLGAHALRGGKTRLQRGLYLALALGVFGWIVSVALARTPLGFLDQWIGI